MVEHVVVTSSRLTATINPFGAELTSLVDTDGRELMTNADPAYWTGHAPILFPIVGALNGDTYRLDGREYSLAKHGFARKSTFDVIEQAADRVTFRLTDSDATRAVYPFAFALDMAFVLDGATLAMTATVTNPGDRDLPASFGFHPAFAWPLPYGGARAAHRIDFAADEPGGLCALDAAGLVLPGLRGSPLDGRTLHLADDLFVDDALMWVPVHSRAVRYGAGDGPALDIVFPDAPMLGVWTKPGAAYVCVEPWWGHADPAGFTGEIWDKPGILRIAPGARHDFAMSVTLAR